MITAGHIAEPELEFGGGFRHVDIRFGIADYGPFDFTAEGRPQRIRVGIVGDTETVEGVARWIERCRGGVAPKASRQPNLFPGFPGFGADCGFRCEFLSPPELHAVLPSREFVRISALADPAAAQKAAVDLLMSGVRNLAERNSPPNAILCALPKVLVEQVVNSTATAEDAEDDEYASSNMRAMLKAAAMGVGVPIQILWPTTYDPSIVIRRKLKVTSTRRVQDEATRAWNFFTALYYKAGGLPWRLLRDPVALRTSFVGISFYRSLDGSRVQTSTAQMFDERGEGLILRGGRAQESKDDKRPFMGAEDAYSLLSRSLTVYREQHSHFPARVVLHKTSPFAPTEIEGFDRALDEKSIDHVDLVAIGQTTTRLFRNGAYPPLRGAYLQADDRKLVLYTKGSVDFFRTYPGMYVPMPLLLRTMDGGRPPVTIAEEVLALSKMNWNNTQFDGGWPITIRAARSVGEILKCIPDGGNIAPRFSFYM